MAAGVPEDLYDSILSRLPWRSMCKLKCTSNHWYDLLVSFSLSPRFLSIRNKEPELLAGMFYLQNDKYKDIRFTKVARFGSETDPSVVEDELIDRGLRAVVGHDDDVSIMPLLPANVRIDCCHHGLLLCSRRMHRYNSVLEYLDGYYICNPITKKFTWLPMPPVVECNDRNAAFIVDHEMSGHYQVIQRRACWKHYHDKMGVVATFDLYSSMSRVWRTELFKVHYVPEDDDDCLLESGPKVHMGGSLYWVAGSSWIACCNIEGKEIRFIEQPKFKGISIPLSTTPRLGEFKGVLHFVSVDERRLCSWDLDAAAGNWKLAHSISTFAITKSLSSTRSVSVFGYSSDAETVLLKLHGKIFSYSFVSNKFEMLKCFHSSIQLKPEMVFPFLLPKMPLHVF